MFRLLVISIFVYLVKWHSLRDFIADDSQQQALQQRIQGGLLHKRETDFLHQGDSGMTPNLSVGG